MSKKSRKMYVLDSARIFNVNYKVKPDRRIKEIFKYFPSLFV